MTRQPAPSVFIGAVVALTHALRPSWDKPGIRSEIEANIAAGYAPGLISAAAVDAAITTSTHTPAGIGARLRDGWGSASHGWTKDQIQAAKPAAKPNPYPRCSCCDLDILTHAGETRETHICSPYVTNRVTGDREEHLCRRQPEHRAEDVETARKRAREAAQAATEAYEQQVKAARAGDPTAGVRRQGTTNA